MKILSLPDVVGLAVFAVCWWGYPWYAERPVCVFIEMAPQFG